MGKLIEPQGILHGENARQAVARGLALPLQGGPAAFALARLIDSTGETLVPAPEIPPGWHESLDRVTRAPPAAGLPHGPLVMGILNVTPDSFSDGGRHFRPEDAVAAGVRMRDAGAVLLDIGGESTRPDASAVDPVEEQARILPVIGGLIKAGVRARGGLISIDTRNASTMRAALDAGADLINDVSALTHDPEAAAFLASRDCSVVLMHSRGTPGTMGGFAHYADVGAEVVRELEASIAGAERAGIARSRIIVDPGIGFAKDAAHNLELLRRLPLLANLGCRILLGVSRKRFIGHIAGVERAGERDPGSFAASLAGLAFPGCVLRVHEVGGMLQALRVWQAMQG